LYFHDEVMDIDSPSGSYNLQTAFSTARAAGEEAAK
jgi:predicted flavoprotein YhiN